jgi:hypothetical protein
MFSTLARVVCLRVKSGDCEFLKSFRQQNRLDLQVYCKANVKKKGGFFFPDHFIYTQTLYLLTYNAWVPASTLFGVVDRTQLIVRPSYTAYK